MVGDVRGDQSPSSRSNAKSWPQSARMSIWSQYQGEWLRAATNSRQKTKKWKKAKVVVSHFVVCQQSTHRPLNQFPPLFFLIKSPAVQFCTHATPPAAKQDAGHFTHLRGGPQRVRGGWALCVGRERTCRARLRRRRLPRLRSGCGGKNKNKKIKIQKARGEKKKKPDGREKERKKKKKPTNRARYDAHGADGFGGGYGGEPVEVGAHPISG